GGAAVRRACRRRGVGYDPRHHPVKVRIIHLGRGWPAGEHCGCARPHRLERVPRHPHAITSCIPFWGWFCPWGSACRTRPPGGASCCRSCLLLRLCWAGGFLMCAQIREEGRSLGGERVVVDDVAAPVGQRPVIALLVVVDQRPHHA